MKRSLRSRSQKRRHSIRLGVQQLERRELMAADIGLADGFVSINGTENNDVAEVYSESGSIIVKLSTYDASGDEINATSESYDQADVNGIVFVAGDGDDLFVNDTKIDSITRSGGGNDTVFGGGGNDILAAGTGDDIVLGGGGDDIILGGTGDDLIIPAPAAAMPSDVETPVVEATDDHVESPVAQSESNENTQAVDSEMSVENETNVENELANELESMEDTMLETETDTAVIDLEAIDTELLDIDDPIEDEFDSAGPTTELVVVADEGSNAADAGHVCTADADDSATSEPLAATAEAQSFAEDTASSEAAEQSLPVDVTDPAEKVGEDQAELLEQPETTNSEDSISADDVATADQQVPLDAGDANVDDEDDQAETLDEPETMDSEDPVVSADTGSEATDNDVIFGGSGDDWILGEDGDDMIFGGESAIDDALLRLVIAGRL